MHMRAVRVAWRVTLQRFYDPQEGPTVRVMARSTCQSQQATPKKAYCNPSKLSEAEVDYIIEWITSLKHMRCMPYYKVIEELNLSVGKNALA
ncbi:hypothetical protein TSTA_051420 [Talaromyces stipitatus ATCC 10500]|uniref:Uncharacterized protein n=1 Tax=Talaromyces stipitatus (strain ATCC 10500 / CBS 375.48 / QM 6759 / NRRL 1006) TaxID=441959 RepID=B8MJ44_TALSN|nr:uncharacterized protein TSTA_051420 [Talaromyces stipitatus ATCC 10500]EED15706.1 hypothetical protein TSTA_051420 [Talaromyces stipitatus ATCC 10500]